MDIIDIIDFRFAILASACLLAEAAGAGNLIKNPGFETMDAKGNPEHWSPPAKTYSYVSGAGRNGTCALQIIATADRYGFPSQRVELIPGETYDVEAWVRTENLSGSGTGGSLAVEWRKKDGSWGGGVYSTGVKGTSSGFQKVKCQVKVPMDAGVCSLSPYVPEKMSGKAWFDDISVTVSERPLLGTMMSSAYRNSASDGIVRFSVAVPADPVRVKKEGMKGVFTVVTETGALRRFEVGIFEAAAETDVPVEDLAKGAAPVEFSLVNAGGQTVASRHIMFSRISPEEVASRKVRIGINNLTFVDGKPFFPLGFYMGGAHEQNLKAFEGAPFNCIMAYGPPTKEQMDSCLAKGLKVIYSVKDAYSGTRSTYPEIRSEADEVPYVASKVVRFRDHPALLAWYVNDELGLDMIDRLNARHDLISSMDPNHPTWTVLYQVETLRGYNESCDILGTDPYPIFQTGDPPISQVAEHTRLTRKAVFGGKALWQVPQVFDWGLYRKQDANKTRPPTEEEMQNMTWQFIAEGGNGIIYYTYDCLDRQKEKVDPKAHWMSIVRIANGVKRHMPIMLSLDEPPLVTCSEKAVSVRAWRHGGGIWLLAVNTTRQSRTYSVRVAGVETEFCGTLKGLGVSFSKLDRASLKQ